jgi:hypothetical protein
MTTVPDLKELFKQAAEIAQQVPAPMQEAAFNRALEMLTATSSGQRERHPKGNQPPSRRPARASVEETGSAQTVQQLMESIDSTEHPGVSSASKVLDRALMILQIALKDHSVDGLAPSEIASILTDKFRLNTTDAAVRMALGKAAKLVNRVPRGTGFVYRIMGPGESYLVHPQDRGAIAPPAKHSSTRGPSKPAKRGQSPGSTRGVADADTGTSKKSRRSSSGAASANNPRASLDELLRVGYFNDPRTAVEVLDHLRTKRGLTFSPAPLRVTMLRMVRDKVLDRDTNAEGQYEYSKRTA